MHTHAWVGARLSQARQRRARELSLYELATKAPRNTEWHDYGTPGKQRRWNGKKFVYRDTPSGGGGGGSAPAQAQTPKTPKAAKGAKTPSGAAKKGGKTPVPIATGTGGRPGPNRKPTPEERKASIIAKSKLPSPKRGAEAFYAMGDLLDESRFDSDYGGPATNRIVEALIDLSESPDAEALKGLFQLPVRPSDGLIFVKTLRAEKKRLDDDLAKVTQRYNDKRSRLTPRDREDQELMEMIDRSEKAEKQWIGKTSSYYEKLPLYEKIFKYLA